MDVIAVVDKLAELHIIKPNRVIGNWYSIYCPIHNDGQEKKPSCGVLIHSEVRNGQTYPEGLVHCFSCGWAKSLPDTLTEIFKQRNISTKDGLDWLKDNITGFEETEFDYLIPKTLVQDLNSKFAVNYMMSKSINTKTYVTEEELSNYRYTIPYMYERKLTDEVIAKFDVGVDLKYVPANRKKPIPCITFPVRDFKGNVLFIYRRSVESKNFYMPAGLEKPVYGIYELPDNAKSIVICESIFNALTCYVYGVPAVALFGTGTKSQISTLKQLGANEFILGLDPDDAGDRGSQKLKSALKSVAIVRRMQIPKGKDINDLSLEEFNQALNDRI